MAHTFAGRFFENEITSSTRDLRSSFFWLIAFLAQPGFIVPMLMFWDWSMLAFQGVEALRIGSWDEKTVYLGYSMSAAGVLAAVVWGALLLDRRDALVLGVIPTTTTRLVAGKLAALGAYALIVFVGMHLVGAFLFGALLAGHEGAAVAFAGMAAHLAASVLASVTVLIGVAGLQGLVAVAIGAVRFARISSLFQLGVTIVALGNLMLVAPIASALNQVAHSQNDHPAAWVMWMPVAWFLGLYEVMLGAPEPFLATLSWTAVQAFAAACLLTLICQPLAFRTLMVALVEQTPGTHAETGATKAARWLARRLTTQTNDQAVLEFALLTLLRVDRHRLTMAMGLGAACAWCVPLVVSTVTSDELGLRASAFGAPLAAMVFLLIAVRTALAMPGDLRASWVFDVAPTTFARMRPVLRRLLLVVVVAPAVVFGVVLVWFEAGATAALWAGGVTVLTGWLMVEASVWRWAVVPAARAWNVGQANLQATWPWYIGGFVLLTVAIPRATMAALNAPLVGVALVMVLGAATYALARSGIAATEGGLDEERSVAAPRLDL